MDKPITTGTRATRKQMKMKRNKSDITRRRSRLTGVQNLQGHVVANAIIVPGTAVAKAGVVAAAPLEGQLSNSKCS